MMPFKKENISFYENICYIKKLFILEVLFLNTKFLNGQMPVSQKRFHFDDWGLIIPEKISTTLLHLVYNA